MVTMAMNETTEDRAGPLELVENLIDAEDFDGAVAAIAELHIADGARVLENLDRESQALIAGRLPPERVAQTFEHLETEHAVDLSSALDAAVLSAILDEASPDVAADVLRGLPEHDREAVIGAMGRALEVAPLLNYPDDTAGGLMVPDFVSLRDWMNTEDAVSHLRRFSPDQVYSNYLLVLDRCNVLVGVVHMRDLVLAPAAAPVPSLMNTEVVRVGPDADQEECVRVVQRDDLTQLPVVDDQGRALGVILGEDILDVIEEEATEDMLHLASIAGAERVLNPIGRSFRNRFPWLLLNLATVLLAATVIDVFEQTIARAAFLAVFLPMVASQGGIAGTQTLTLVTRGIALGDLTWANARRPILKEILLGVVNGVVFGVVAGALAWVWKGNIDLGLIVLTAMIGNLLVAAAVGYVTPLALKAARLDPAVGAAVVVTTFTDVAGFGLLLGLAAWWL